MGKRSYEKEENMEIQLYYVEKGQGEPLILLHGNGEDSAYFEKQIAFFSKAYRVIAIDTRGHGKSPRGDAPFTIRQFVKDLSCFMGKQKIERANILGFSDGGNIALLFAIQYPKKVRRLIINGANLNGNGVKPSVQIPIVIGYKIASFFARINKKAKSNAEMLGLMVNDPAINPKELSRIKAKTLVIAGTRDMIKENHTRFIHKNIPGAKLAIIPGDHFVANRSPAVFNRTVWDFLQKES